MEGSEWFSSRSLPEELIRSLFSETAREFQADQAALDLLKCEARNH